MSVISEVTEEMKVKTQNKFDAWDGLMKNDPFENEDIKGQTKAMHMLEDPTVYMYAFFRNPNNSEEPMKLYPYQDLIINDPNKRIIFTAANQIGKSLTLCCSALHSALTKPGETFLMVSRTLPQSKDLLRQIRALLQSSNLDYQADIGDSYNKTEVYFRHYETYTEDGEEKQRELPQSRIICVPATEAALGYAANKIYIDELGFYEAGSHFYYQIALPRTFTTKGQVIIFSNPNGQQGILWELWNKNNNFSKYRFNFLDKPGNTLEEYDDLARAMPVHRFESTVDAIFTSPEGGFISLKEREDMQDESLTNNIPAVVTSPLYIFYDFAKVSDRTVRIIGIPINANKDDWAPEVLVKEMKEYPDGTDYSLIVDELKQLIDMYGWQNIAMVGWDNTGVGSGIEDFIKRVNHLGIPAMPVEFSLQNKARIYTLFKLLIEQRRVKLPFVEECDKQLAALRFKMTGRGYLQVHHEKEGDRDDFPDALAGLCSLIIQPENPPVTATIITGQESEEETDPEIESAEPVDGLVHGFIKSE